MRGQLAALALLAACNSSSGGLIPSMPAEIGGPVTASGGTLVFSTQYFRPNNCGYSYDGYACGWQVQLFQAVIGAGPFYFYTAPPDSNNDQTGSVILQVLPQQFVDVLDPTLHPIDGGANGETGLSPSVDVFLLPPGCTFGQPSNTNGGATCSTLDQGPLAAYENMFSIPSSDPGNPNDPQAALEQLQLQTLAGGSTAFVAGVATEMLAVMLDGGLTASGTELDGGLVDAGLVTVPFYGFLTVDESVGGGGSDQAAATVLSLEQVAGASPCPDGGGGCVCHATTGETDGGAEDGGIQCSMQFTTQPSVLQIRIDPSHWFDGVDFSLLQQEQYTGRAWLPDSGSPLTWNFLNGRQSADSSFNTALVQGGLHAATGVYFFSLVPQGSN